jgi:regulator of sigma E protease
VAERAGLRTGDWVQARQTADGEWQDVRSINDLRWHLTRQLMSGQPLTLQVSDAAGRGTRQVRIALDQLAGENMDADLVKRVGLGGAYSEPVMGEVKAGGPAAAAGLRQGDRVLRVDGVAVDDAQALRERIRNSVRDGQVQPMQWQVERQGQTLAMSVTPRVTRDGERSLGRVDAYIGTPPAMVTVRLGLLDGLEQGVRRTWEVSALTLRMIGRMLVGEASLKNLSGPLTIADAAGQSVQQGLSYYLGFLALVSVSLGVLNLLPLPMLDGGHLMYYIFEALTGRPVSEPWLARLQRGGVAVLLMMMSVALFNDVARLLGQF